MPIPWLTALKVIPWGDVIEHAPKVLNAARKLMDRQPAPKAPVQPSPPMDPAAEPPSMGELRNRLIEARQLIDQQTALQQQLAQTVTDLAEQNARLVDAVDKLRVRTRLMLGATVALALSTLWLWLR